MSFVAIFALLCCCFKVLSMSLFYYCLCGFFCCCRCFNSSLCHFSPFLLSYVAVSRSCPSRYFYYCLCAFLCRCHCFNPSLCHFSPFLLSYVAVLRSCQCQYFTIVFVLFSVAVTVLTHLCVICRHFCSPMLLFQGHVSVSILLLFLCFSLSLF